MNRLAWLSREAPAERGAVRLDTQRHMAAAMARYRRPRPVARQLNLIGKVPAASRTRTRAAAPSRCPDCSPNPAPGAATACSRHIAPATAKATAPCLQGAPHTRRNIAPQRRQRPAVAGDVVQQQQQHMLALAKHKQMRPQRRLAAQIKAALAAASSAAASAASLTLLCSNAAAPLKLPYLLPGIPDVSGKTVRRLSCRSTTSPSAASSAS